FDVKLLFDHNLSPKLVRQLAELYPDSEHVRDLKLHKADDEAVWNHAREHGLVIASKDSDFHQRSFLYGFPPKVIWIRRGNCTTRDIEEILRKQHGTIQKVLEDRESSFLALA